MANLFDFVGNEGPDRPEPPDDDAAAVCEHCGAKLVEYKHSLNLGLVVGLGRLRRAGGPVNIKELKLTHYQWANFQKLRYWGMVEQCAVDGKINRGVWNVTPFGEDFLDGKARCRRAVWTYRAQWVRWDGELVGVQDVAGDQFYQLREEWAAESRPHNGEADHAG